MTIFRGAGRKRAAVLLALLWTLGAAGCEPAQSEAPAPAETGTTAQPAADLPAGYFGLAYFTGEPVSPTASHTRINRILVEALYEGLFELDEAFQSVPVLCESWQSDGLTWTFQLKSGVTFWSGAPLTAADVAASFQAAKDDETSPYHARFADVAAIAGEGSTLTLTLLSPNAGLCSLLDVPVCRAGTGQDAFADGTGPFRAIQEGGSWRLYRNSSWHGGTAGGVDTITLVATARTEELRYGFETGDISLTRAERISPKASAVSGSINGYQTRTADFHYLGFNMEHGAVGQAVVRRAISLLLPRTSLCSTQLQGYADPAVLPVNPQPAGAATGGDAEGALALLTEAGFADTNGDGNLDHIPPPTRWYTPYWHEEFAPSILVNSDNPYKVAAAQAIAASLQSIGIGASVNAVPYDEYRQALERGKFDIYYGETQLTPDFDLRALVAEKGELNFGKYKNDELAAALNTMRATGDKTVWYEAFSAELPIVPLAFERCQVVTRAGLLENFEPLPYQIFANVEHWEAR